MLVLLDRDGVINEDTPTGVLKFEDFIFLPRAIEAIVKLTKAGFDIAVCTNQSAIGKGWTTHEIVHQVHDYLCDEVAKAGGKIGAIYYAPEGPGQLSTRRKPAPGMLREAMENFGANPEQTPFVGDMIRDLDAAVNAGCPRILVRTGKGAGIEAKGVPERCLPVVVVDDILAAAEHIIATYRQSNLLALAPFSA